MFSVRSCNKRLHGDVRFQGEASEKQSVYFPHGAGILVFGSLIGIAFRIIVGLIVVSVIGAL
jgi:hypothetical protein